MARIIHSGGVRPLLPCVDVAPPAAYNEYETSCTDCVHTRDILVRAFIQQFNVFYIIIILTIIMGIVIVTA